MIDDDDDFEEERHYLKRDDYDCKVFATNGEVFALTVHNVQTEEEAQAKAQAWFKKKHKELEFMGVVSVTATDISD